MSIAAVAGTVAADRLRPERGARAQTPLSVNLLHTPQRRRGVFIVTEIAEASYRVNETITSVRGVFKNATDRISLEDVARQVLRFSAERNTVKRYLCRDGVSCRGAFVHADGAQLQQVIPDMFKNATEAMASTTRDRPPV